MKWLLFYFTGSAQCGSSGTKVTLKKDDYFSITSSDMTITNKSFKGTVNSNGSFLIEGNNKAWDSTKSINMITNADIIHCVETKN